MSKIKNYIPKNCVLAGVDIITVITENKQNAGNLGKSSIANGVIQLQSLDYGIEISNTQMQNTYFHELVHQMLNSIGELELSENEKFVQNMGNMIFEFLRTADWIRLEEFKHNKFSDADSNAPFIKEGIAEIK